jgi:hypothetical protein
MKEINLKDFPKRKVMTTRRTILVLQKLQNDAWRIHTLDKDIQKSVTDYLNRIGEDAIEERINYKGSPITVFKLTPEAVKFIKESPESFPVTKYVIYHRPKDSKRAWSAWRG